MATVSLQQVNKVYPNGFHAVHDLSLEIGDGEFMALVGPSGCGKTTALRMVAGLEDISSGTMRIGEREVNDLSPKERDVAMVFQNYALYPHMTVAENIGFALKLRKLPKDELNAKVRETAEILGLTEWLDRKPSQLSGGQRQRVAMGRAIVREPSVFLMDEPLSNLDAKLRVQMRAEVSRIQRRIGVATIYVTHDQIEARTMGDRSLSCGPDSCSSSTPRRCSTTGRTMCSSPPSSLAGHEPLRGDRRCRRPVHPHRIAGGRPAGFRHAGAPRGSPRSRASR